MNINIRNVINYRLMIDNEDSEDDKKVDDKNDNEDNKESMI